MELIPGKLYQQDQSISLGAFSVGQEETVVSIRGKILLFLEIKKSVKQNYKKYDVFCLDPDGKKIRIPIPVWQWEDLSYLNWFQEATGPKE